jgi:YidC/Oxa1 family membrane protein insertase
VSNQRNMILAIILTGLLLFGWDAAVRYFYPHASRPTPAASPAPKEQAAPGTHTREGGLASPAEQALEVRDLRSALAAPRVPIEAPGLSGSINLTGGVLDDLTVKRHSAAVEKESGPARIFSPAGTPAQHFAQFGWVGQGVQFPSATTVWTVPAGAKLTPQTPVTLTWTNPSGQVFGIRYAIDTDYMITATATVLNRGQASISAEPFALLNRTEKTASLDSWNIHSGPFGAFDGKVSFGPDYDEVKEAGQFATEGKADWIGFTDIYWMSTLIPDKAAATSAYRTLPNGTYRADLIYRPQIVGAGQQLTRTTRLFAGAKESTVLDRYEDAGVAKFGLAIDWGWFRWFEKPIFWLLKALFQFTGNFGLAIILLTVIVRGIMFPIAQKQFASMAQMRAIQPKMKALQERFKDDKPKLQEETMKLYKQEGVNPLAGCLPIFLQIPVFFALYKVLMVSIEMRHQPFVLWIKDLSAPDPAHILNLFGLLPFTPPSFLGIGVLAVLLGITMWLQFKLNPAAPDPMQQQVFAIMPWMMMFIMAPFAAGLLIYWITSNLLTIAQQKFLYARHPQLKVMVDKERSDVTQAAKAK